MFSQLTWIILGLSIVNLPDKMSCQTTNLTAITWDHAVNSQELLRNSLNSTVDYIEADISLGVLINDSSQTLQPIMAHPPATTSDITLENFLKDILNYNLNHTSAMKGVKLDFKSIEVFEGSMSLLKELWPNMAFPVWLNADIVPGPVNNVLTVPVNPVRFLNGSKEFPRSTLSVGWTTLWGPNFTDGSYTDSQIESMSNALSVNSIPNSGHPITFPIRAGIAAHSLKILSELYERFNKTNVVTFTIWSSAGDAVEVEKLRELIFHFGLDKVYVDVPEELKSQLRLDVPPENNSAMTLGGWSVYQLFKYFIQFILNFYVLKKRF